MAGGSRKGKYDVAPIVRHAFLNAMKEVSRRKGKNFSAVMADWLEENPIQTLNAVSKFLVREKKVEGHVEHNHQHNGLSGEAERLIAELAGVGANPGNAKAGEDGSLLPPEACSQSTRH